MNYQPYSMEWTRRKYLSEALQSYVDADVPAEVIINDLTDIMSDWVDDHVSKIDQLQLVIDSLTK